MSRIQIPVALLEFDEGGKGLWVCDDEGSCILRVNLRGGRFRVEPACQNISAHCDIVVPDGDVVMCLPPERKEPDA